MAETIIGDLSTLVQQTGRTEVFSREGSRIVTTYKTDYSNVAATKQDIGDQHPVSTSLYVSEVSVTRDGDDYCTVQTTWEPKAVTQTTSMPLQGRSAGDIDYSLDVNAYAVPIKQHPNYWTPEYGPEPDAATHGEGPWLYDSNGTFALGAAVTLYKHEGVTDFNQTTSVWTKRELVAGWTATEANVKGGLNKIEVPDGMTTPTAGLWLKTDYRANSVSGSLWEVTESWTMLQDGWAPLVYPVPAGTYTVGDFAGYSTTVTSTKAKV